MEAKTCSIKYLVSQGTQYDTLCAAIRIAYSHGVKDAMLTSNFEVNRLTLNKLKRNVPISRNKEVYFEAITTTLNNLRLKAKSKGDEDKETDLTKALSEIAMVRSGIAPDWEIEERDREKEKQEFMDSISCKQG